MRLAILSDIHGNFAALQAVVRDLDRQGVDEVLVGGDVAQGGRQPAEVLDFLIDRRWPTVLGNADDFLLRCVGGSASPDDPNVASGEWTVQRLRPEHVAYLRGPPELIRRRSLAGVRLALVHASPWSVSDIVLPDASEDIAQKMLTSAHADVVAYGHIHTAYRRRVGEGLLVSVGAVVASNDQDPRPAYSILTLDPDLQVEVRRVSYDVEGEIAAQRAAGNPLRPEVAQAARSGGPWPVRSPTP